MAKFRRILYSSSSKHSPRWMGYVIPTKLMSIAALGNLGNILNRRGRIAEAEKAFKQALLHRPNMADVHYNLGVLYQQQNRPEEAVLSYKNAIHFRPKLVLAYLNLGITLGHLGKRSEALQVLESSIRIDDHGLKDPRSHNSAVAGALFHLGKILHEDGKSAEALPILEKAFERAKLIAGCIYRLDIIHLIGVLLQWNGQSSLAEQWFQTALKEDQHHIPSHLSYAKLLATNKSRVHEAEQWFLKAKTIAPKDSLVSSHYALFLMDSGRNQEAALEFQQATRLQPNSFDHNFNAAVAFRQAGNHPLAEAFYRKAADIRPEDASAHMNLGAMLHLEGKLGEAESHYLIALGLNPADQSTKVNLGRLHNLMKRKGLPIRRSLGSN